MAALTAALLLLALAPAGLPALASTARAPTLREPPTHAPPEPAGLDAVSVAVSAGPDAASPDTLEGAWDSPRVRELVASVIEARRHAYSDSALHSFRARAQGHVYYLGGIGADSELSTDGLAPGERQVVRADQVALDVAWRSPDRWRQTMVGRRSEKRLPTSIRYHIDHLVLVMGNFGDRIRMGEGTEVRDVLHPAAPGALEFYEYRLADSLGMKVADREIRMYEVQVRPRDHDSPGVVGELRVVRESRAVARMRFTFTPAAYLDPKLERIEVDLQSALYRGRWWLPAEQATEIRRQVRWLAVPLTGVIRTRLRVRDMEINVDVPSALPPGGRVVRRPERSLAAFDEWGSGLYDGPLLAGEEGELELSAVRRAARRIVRDRHLSGTSRLGPAMPAISRVLRVRRAEGALAGAGGRVRLDDVRRLEAWLGHPFEMGGMEWSAAWHGPLAGGRIVLRGYGDRFTDVGPWAGASGLVSSLGFLLSGEDYTDPWLRSGAAADWRAPAGNGTLRLGLAVEEHRSARLVALPPGDEAARAVRPVAAGDEARATLGWSVPLGDALGLGWRASLTGQAAAGQIGGWTRLLGRVEARSGTGAGPWGWHLEGGLGIAGGDLPPQRLLLLGGRGSVPGYAFRRWGGDRAGWVVLEASREVAGPWVALRGLAAAGWAEVAGPGAPAAARFGGPAGGTLAGTGGVRPSVGLGLGVLDGILRADLVRGLDGGRWEWVISAHSRFRGVL